MSVYSAARHYLLPAQRGGAGLTAAGTAGRPVPAGLVLSDLATVMLSVVVATKWFHPGMPAFHVLFIGALAAVFLTTATAVRGGYRLIALATGPYRPAVALQALVVGGGTVMGLAYLELLSVPPGQLGIAVGGSGTAIAGARLVHHLGTRARIRTGRDVRRLLLVGPAPRCAALEEVIGRHDRHGITVLGRCSVESPDEGALGDVSQVPELVNRLGVDIVVVAAGALSATRARKLGWALEGRGADLLIAADVDDVAPHRTTLVSVDGTPMTHVRLGPTRTARVLKSVMDRSLGLLLGIACLAVLVPAAIAIKTTSAGPVLFRQTRVGRHGHPFTMVKLRTMYVDAEDRLPQLHDRSDGNEVLFKMRRDPRVTPVGRFLRRFSIDELPQVWNVITGDMSLVGPRPPLPREVAKYDDRARQRLVTKPGLTGLWQVSGRSDLDWRESVRLDLHYVDNLNAQTDLRILARTARAVLGGRGAY